MKEIDSSKPIPGIQQIKGLEDVSQKEKDLKHDLVTYILANMLHETVQKHLEAHAGAVKLPSEPPKPTLGATAPPTPKPELGATAPSQPKPTLGAAAPSGAVGAEPPLPPLPSDSGSSPLDPSVPPTERQILEKIDAFLEDLHGDPSNADTLQKFITFMTNLSQRPGGITAKEAQLLDGKTVDGVAGSGVSVTELLGPAMQEMIILKYFEGGQGAAQDFIDKMNGFLQGLPDNKYIDSMKAGLNGFNLPGFAQANPNGVWTINGYEYHWDDPEDRFAMLSQLFNLGPKGTAPNPFFDKFNVNAFGRQYRLMQVDDMIAAAHGNPDLLLIMLSLWFMSDADNRVNRQEGGLASTTNLTSKVTNDYMTAILNKIKSIGKDFTGKDAADLGNLYTRVITIMNSQGQLSGLADGLNKNTVAQINGIMVPDPRGAGNVSLGSLFQGFKNGQVSGDQLATALKSLVPTPPAGGEPSSSTSPGFQALITAMESGGGLVTGLSKTVSTQLEALANVDNAILKFGHTIADSTGGGIAQLLTKIVGNQISR